MGLNAIAEKLKRQSKDEFKDRHFDAWLIERAVTWYLRYRSAIMIGKRCFGSRASTSIKTRSTAGIGI